ncbi:MAG: hypothetical protein H0U12_07150 [Thermoleophilaceae bacterium]|nr:hypothetical protein [Thermoleophilaceae bacterium]
MSDPLFGSLYVDVPQTGVAVRRIQNDKKFVAARMIPKLVVLKPSGLYPTIVSGDLNRDEMEARSPSAPAQKAGWRRVMKRFETDARSLRYDLNDADAAGADVETNPDILIPRILGYKALLHMERRMVGKFFAAGVWERNITGGGADAALDTNAVTRLYMDNAAADPIEAFTDEIRRLCLRAGCDPMELGLTLGNKLWHKIRNHAKVKSQIVGLAGGAIGNAVIAMARQAEAPELARLLGIRDVLVGTAIHNTKALALDVADVPTNAAIVPEEDALLYVNPYTGDEGASPLMSLDNEQPAAFCRPVWNGVASGEGVQIRRVRDEHAGPGGSWSHVIDVYNGFEVVSAEAAVRFTDMLT